MCIRDRVEGALILKILAPDDFHGAPRPGQGAGQPNLAVSAAAYLAHDLMVRNGRSGAVSYTHLEVYKRQIFVSRRNAAPIVVYAATEEDFPAREELEAIQRGIEAVSYTHLDVYKRQVLRISSRDELLKCGRMNH